MHIWKHDVVGANNAVKGREVVVWKKTAKKR